MPKDTKKKILKKSGKSWNQNTNYMHTNVESWRMGLQSNQLEDIPLSILNKK